MEGGGKSFFSGTRLKIVTVRVTIVLFWTAALAFALYICFKNPVQNDVYGFIVHDESLFHCPSCGLTRAVYSLLRLDFASAFYYHAFFTVTFPLWAYAALALSVNLFAAKKVVPYPKCYRAILWTAFGLWMVFTFLRNFTSVIY